MRLLVRVSGAGNVGPGWIFMNLHLQARLPPPAPWVSDTRTPTELLVCCPRRATFTEARSNNALISVNRRGPRACITRQSPTGRRRLQVYLPMPGVSFSVHIPTEHLLGGWDKDPVDNDICPYLQPSSPFSPLERVLT